MWGGNNQKIAETMWYFIKLYKLVYRLSDTYRKNEILEKKKRISVRV